MLYLEALPIEIYMLILTYIDYDNLTIFHKNIKTPKYKMMLQLRYKEIYNHLSFIKSIDARFTVYSYKTIYYDCLKTDLHFQKIILVNPDNNGMPTLTPTGLLDNGWYDELVSASNLHNKFPKNYNLIVDKFVSKKLLTVDDILSSNDIISDYNLWISSKENHLMKLFGNIDHLYLMAVDIKKDFLLFLVS